MLWLYRLSSAGSNVLEDTSLVENLETTKRTAAEIESKVTEARGTSRQIDAARELYRPAAARASLLYFILNDLNTINPIYQFSLKAFSVVFQKAILKADPASDVAKRVQNLIECITYSVFMYTSRGLFECDKLIFASQMAFQILLARNEVTASELDFLLRFPITPHVTSPVDFLTNTSWGGIRSLATREEFRYVGWETVIPLSSFTFSLSCSFEEIWIGTSKVPPNVGKSSWSANARSVKSFLKSGKIKRQYNVYACWELWGQTGWRMPLLRLSRKSSDRDTLRRERWNLQNPLKKLVRVLLFFLFYRPELIH